MSSADGTIERHRRELAEALETLTGSNVPLRTDADRTAVSVPLSATGPLVRLLEAFGLEAEGDRAGEAGTVLVPDGDVWRAARIIDMLLPGHAELLEAVAAGRLEPVPSLTKYAAVAGSIKPNEWADMPPDEQERVLAERAAARAEGNSWQRTIADNTAAVLVSYTEAIESSNPADRRT